MNDLGDFSQKLIRWYNLEKRDLPWRRTKNPYFVWLSEIILQQTRVAQGMKYYQNFTEKYPTIFDLAQASEQEILKLWQGLGYYSRAKNLHQTAKYIANNENGIFPISYKEIIKLKGIGDYTASAIASICFNEPVAVVDGNVYRVLSRFFGIEIPINSSKGIKYFKSLATELLDKNNAGTHNQALMDFGAIQCKPQSPNCQSCIFETQCQAYSLQKINLLPVKTTKIKIKKRFFHYCFAIDKNNQTIINQRVKKDIWQGLYELPLIELPSFSDDEQVISLIVKMFQNIISIEKENEEIIHKLSHQHIYANFWIVKVDEILTSEAIPLKKIKDFPVSTLVDNFLKRNQTKLIK